MKWREVVLHSEIKPLKNSVDVTRHGNIVLGQLPPDGFSLSDYFPSSPHIQLCDHQLLSEHLLCAMLFSALFWGALTALPDWQKGDMCSARGRGGRIFCPDPLTPFTLSAPSVETHTVHNIFYLRLTHGWTDGETGENDGQRMEQAGGRSFCCYRANSWGGIEATA